MKRKGFTLIELLAVIVVLTVVMLIAIPTMIGVINKVRLNALKDSAYGLIDASNLYYAMNDVSKNQRFDKNEKEDTLKELKYKGNVKEGTVIISNKGKVTVCITDGHNSAYKNYNESEVKLVSKKTCNIPSSTYVVYLDNEATLTELSNQELTDEIAELRALIAQLQTEKANQSDLEVVSGVASNNQETISSLATNSDFEALSTIVSSKATLDEAYPVGSIYITITENTAAKVQAKLGGTWQSFGEGRTIIGAGTGKDTNNVSKTFNANSTGGEYNHTLTINEMPSHSHSGSPNNTTRPYYCTSYASGAQIDLQLGTNGQVSSTGGNQPHNNLQPYITTYMYKRIS